ncbi:hypothetical protein [Chitinophaga sp. Cy-1792]|uniref:hypothetical protein n=1 Tax=Chitinophaga sp. Cy-1792 TaxID=2608339 RepID=UPI0014233819|nr:hypothetical protein [Chitinophaga sp. Cy-1792]NIG54660.1 hypothetical protein [Chitinophaga sp. Cy-1792]
MSTVKDLASTACPYCGSNDIIRAIPEQNSSDAILVCRHCQRVVVPGHSSNASRKAITEQAINLCLSHGLIHGIQYYLTENNKIPGQKMELRQAKNDLEGLLASRGLTNAIKKPSKNGCVITLIVLALILASVIYFFTRH